MFQSNNPHEEITTEKKGGKSIFPVILIFGILVLAVVGTIGGFLIGSGKIQTDLLGTSTGEESVPTPTPISQSVDSWVTYENGSHGISLRHPSLNETCCEMPGPVLGSYDKIVVLADYLGVGSSGPEGGFNGVGFYVEKNPLKKTFREYVDTQKQLLKPQFRDLSGNFPEVLELPLVVDGQAGVILKGSEWWGADLAYIPFPDDDRILVIAMTEEREGSFKEKFEKIVETVHFLNEEEIIASWKVFEENGMRFSYPTNYLVQKQEEGAYVLVNSELEEGEVKYAEFSINMAMESIYADYAKTVSALSQSIGNARTEQIKNGIKIVGVHSGGKTQGMPVLVGVFKHPSGGAIIFERTNSQGLNEGTFDRIASTVEFY